MEKDSAWSSLILVGAFVSMFLETGMIKSFGVLLPVLREQFSAQTWVIGLAISLLPGFGAVTCIMAAGLKMYSSRVIIMLFGVLSSVGVLLCSMAEVVPVFAFGLILSGFACGAEATTFAVLPVYFDRYYDISNSIAHAGLGLGVMIMPLLTQFLLDTYGWQGSLLILAALSLHIGLSGMLLRPVKHSLDSCKSVYQAALIRDSDNNKTKTNRDKEHLHFLEAIIEILDLDDLTNNSECIALCVAAVGYGYYYTGWLIYLVPHAEDLGFSPYAASVLATAGGVGNLTGCCAFPLMAKLLSSKTMLIFFHVIASISLAVDPLLSVGPFYFGLLSAAFVLNFAFATFGCAYNTRVVEILHQSRIHSFVNWSYVAYGIGSIFSGFISGWLYDQYGNFSASFIVLSIVPMLSLIPMIVLSFGSLKKDRHYTAINRNTDHEDKDTD